MPYKQYAEPGNPRPVSRTTLWMGRRDLRRHANDPYPQQEIVPEVVQNPQQGIEPAVELSPHHRPDDHSEQSDASSSLDATDPHSSSLTNDDATISSVGSVSVGCFSLQTNEDDTDHDRTNSFHPYLEDGTIFGSSDNPDSENGGRNTQEEPQFQDQHPGRAPLQVVDSGSSLTETHSTVSASGSFSASCRSLQTNEDETDQDRTYLCHPNLEDDAMFGSIDNLNSENGGHNALEEPQSQDQHPGNAPFQIVDTGSPSASISHYQHSLIETLSTVSASGSFSASCCSIQTNEIVPDEDDDYIYHLPYLEDDRVLDFGEDSDPESDGGDAQGDPHPFDEQPQTPHQNQVPPDHVLLREKLNTEFSRTIEDRPAASRGETLLNILELCKHYSLPCQAHEDINRIVNSIFYKEVIPESKYKIDKLYSSRRSISYYFYCSQCYEYFGKLNHQLEKQKICQRGHINHLSDLTKASYFVIFDIAEQLEVMLAEPGVASLLVNPLELPLNHDGVMRDMYYGEMYSNFVESLQNDRECRHISLTACTDGTPLYESSDASIWPLFCEVNEWPPSIRMKNNLIVGLWFRSHPKMDIFLDAFVDYTNDLSVRGFKVNISGNETLIKAHLIACCVDSGARGSVQGIHCHNGAFPCSWCLHPGQVEGHGSTARKFPMLEEEPEKRSAAQMVRDGTAVLREHHAADGVHVNGVTNLSPLLRSPKFDIVNGMIVDVLHWANFGIGKQFFKIWLGERKTVPFDPHHPPRYYIGSPETKDVLNRRLGELRPPKEVRRMIRDFTCLPILNAREWENLILYYSIAVLINILPDVYLKHWTLFVQGLYLLLKSKLTQADIHAAGQLLHKFVSGIEDLYNVKEMTYNVHISLHAAENVQRWGAMCYISTFAFENGNGQLKKEIHAQRGIPHQVIRSLGQDSALKVLRQQASTPQTERFRSQMDRKKIKKCFYVEAVVCIMPKSFQPTPEEAWLCHDVRIDSEVFSECKRIIVDHTCYSSYAGGKTDNTFVSLLDGKIAKIRKIICSHESKQVFLFISRVRCSPFMTPSRNIGVHFSPFMYKVDLIEEERSIICYSKLDTVCVMCNVDDRFFCGKLISVMPNTLNRF